jgi:hypothetical protein
MTTRRRLFLQHLQGRPLLKRVLLSEVFGPPRSRNPHPAAQPLSPGTAPPVAEPAPPITSPSPPSTEPSGE